MARIPRPASVSTSDFRHDSKRLNNPTAANQGEGSAPLEAPLEYSPHRPPQLRWKGEGETVSDIAALPGMEKLPPDQRDAILEYVAQLENREPWLEWSGKRELPTFAVDPLILQRHEHVSADAILRAAKRQDVQRSLFAEGELSPSQQLDFYQHEMDWSNRLILGDSLQVMASLARRENLAGQVQMIYLDPPYGIKFASNFQPQIGQRDVKEKADDLSREPETVKAFRDTWHLGVHSYLTYLRDRLTLCRELLHESGSIFVQISDENLHRVRCVMDEVFGVENFVSQIAFSTTTGRGAKYLDSVYDCLLWYGKDTEKLKFNSLYLTRSKSNLDARYRYVEQDNGNELTLTSQQISDGYLDSSPRFRKGGLTSQGATQSATSLPFQWQGNQYDPTSNRHWSTVAEGLDRLSRANRLTTEGNSLVYKRFDEDYRLVPIRNIWSDTGGGALVNEKRYVVQTSEKVIELSLIHI